MIRQTSCVLAFPAPDSSYMTFPTTTAHVDTLDPGLDIILDPTDGSPVISAQIWIETGSMHESALAGSGISHLLEHMVFKGTDRFSGEALSQEVQAAGGQWNAYTTFNRTVYYIDGPADSLDLFLSALMEMVFRPTFPEDEFEKEKDVIRREIAMGLDDPDSISSQLLFRTHFQKDHRRHPVIGHRHLFDNISYEEMKTYHHARYQPENCFLVLSGGFDQTQAKEIISREITKGLRPPRQFPVMLPQEPAQIGERRSSQSFAIPTTHLSLAWPTPALTHQDTPALELLATILGGGRSTPLYRVLREEKELAIQVGAYTWIPPQGPGIFSIYTENAPENSPLIEQEILTQIQKICGEDLTHALDRARRQISAAQFKILTTASGRASDLASNWNNARNLNYTRDFLIELNSVTEGDIRRVSQKYLVPNRLSVTSLVPENHQQATQAKHTQTDHEAISEHTLSNGIRVILQRDPKIPVVYGQAVLKAGCLSESPTQAGINSLLASLLLKGTTSRTALEISETLENLGASLKPGAGNNTLAISSYCLRDDLPEVLDLLAEILQEPSFPADAIERERTSHIAHLKEALEDPASLAFREMRSKLWQGQGYGIPSSGTLDSLSALDRLAISAHHSKYFTAKNLVIALFGDLDPETVLADLEEKFSQIPSHEIDDFEQTVPSHSGQYEFSLAKEQAVLAIGYPGLAAHDPRRHSLELIDSWCSDMAGPLFTRIREELGLAYYVSSSIFLGLNTGLAAFYLGTAPDQLELASKELQGQIDQLVDTEIPEDILTRVKANAKARESLRNQSPGTRARMASLDVLLGQPADQHLKLAEHVENVTAKEIHELAQELFSRDRATIVTVSPSPTNQP